MNKPPLDIPADVRAVLDAARMARISVVDDAGVPLMTPACYVLEGHYLFFVTDNFPANIAPLREKQLEHLASHPNMAAMVDYWEEDLNKIGMVLLRGMGEVLNAPGLEQRRVLALVRDKYEQYRGVNMKEQAIIRMELFSVRYWGDLSRIV